MLATALLYAALSSSPALAAVPPAGDHSMVWFEDGFNKALRKARSEERLVFIAFVPDDSDYSRKVLEETLPNEAVSSELSDLICLRFDNKNDARFEQVRRTYNVESYPTFVFANSRGKIEDRIEGFIPVEPMLQQMERIKAAVGTVGSYRAKLEEEPDNLQFQYSLAQMLDNVRDYKSAEKTYDGIRRADPKGKTAVGMRMILDEKWLEIAEAGGDNRAEWNLDPILSQLEGATSEAAFEGWNAVGNFHAGVDGQLGQSIDAFIAAWENIPEDSSRGWARGVASFIVENGDDDLDRQHQDFALKLATVAVDQAQREFDEHVAEYGSSKSEDGGDYAPWLASHIDVLVWCQMAYGERSAAIASCRRTLELDPENAEFQGRLDMLLAQS